ncbi:hypothetical protein HC723_10695 [Vibrio sp. S11_S32]|uniref:hypothetical protein n=1 Tax=Vibrio sp. S11_S32 TaxID=2720225 RepID=UPI00168015C3|nr:hypothetical protein [Vibrio sp. S11_S32]MBD1576896.1 hypothetical protein [Vibrio sp. S11_S32]
MTYDVNVYIDESSICKIEKKHDFFEAIYDLLKLSSAFRGDLLNGVTVRFLLWKCRELDGKNLCIDQINITFLSAVNKLLETDTKRLFKKVFYDKFSKVWNDEQVHSDDICYEMLNGDCVTGDTLAEAAELTLCSKKHPIVFVNNKVINAKVATVIKGWENENREYITIELSDIEVNPNTWLDEKYSVADFCYDITSHDPPTDAQSYLRDSSKYSKTAFINQGRAVYSCNIKRTYHVIDNLHHGECAHVEVWDRFGNHLGEDSLSGIRLQSGDRSKNNPSWLS